MRTCVRVRVACSQVEEMSTQLHLLKGMVRSSAAESRTKEMQNAQLRRKAKLEADAGPLATPGAAAANNSPQPRRVAPGQNVMEKL